MVKLSISNNIVNIDSNNDNNDYTGENFRYLFQLEKKLNIKTDFIDNTTISICRSVLVDWLIHIHNTLKLKIETLYLGIKILDEYLQYNKVSKCKLQLLGTTALFIASKYEESILQELESFIYYTDNSYTKEEFKQMEINIIKPSYFICSKPCPIAFLRRFTIAGNSGMMQYNLAKYLMELTLHDSEFSSFDPSYLAACSLCLTFQLLRVSSWDKTMEYYSTYKEDFLSNGVHKLAKLAVKASGNNYAYRAPVLKYADASLNCVSQIAELKSNLIKKIALGAYVNDERP